MAPGAESPSQGDFAYHPLTLCDVLQENMHMAKGWLVEGLVDVDRFRAALDRVVAKWPTVAGRVEKTGQRSFRLRIPLGPLPSKYEAYSLSVVDSPVPLSHYTPIPVPAFGEALPRHLFISQERQQRGLSNLSTYAASPNAPITHWHITRFTQKGQEYSCIGMLYTHGVFDGLGSSFVVYALVAKLSGKDWDVPLPTPPIAAGLHDNIFQKLLEAEPEIEEENPLAYYPGSSIRGLGKVLMYILTVLWAIWFHGVGEYYIVIPYRAHTRLVQKAREEAEEGGMKDVRLGTGDVFFAWALKTLSNDGARSNSTIAPHCTATLRTEWDSQLKLYPHNCNIAQTLPMFSVRELTTSPISRIAHALAEARTSTSRVLGARRHWKFWQTAVNIGQLGSLFPRGGVADETLIMSNVSMAIVSDIDWSGAGESVGSVVANFVFGVTDLGPIPKLVTINGRLANGDLALSCCVTKKRGELLRKAVEQLLQEYDR